MMAGNPNWWAMFPPSLPFTSFADQPQSWSHLLLGEEDRVLNQSQMSHYHPKKLENWEDQILNTNNNNNPSPVGAPNFVDIVKQEVSNRDQSVILQAASSTTLISHTNKFLDFSYHSNNNQAATAAATTVSVGPDRSPESNRSTVARGACKKVRINPPSTSQPPLKVRKEKLVDRITALHQIVSPFGKTDTASVLSEAIGYIRFLQAQIEALSSPYLRSAPKDLRNSQPSLLNDSCLKRKATPNQGEEISQEKPLKDLKSRGLCLVPVSCTQLVGGDNNNGAAYWAPANYATGF